MIRRNPGLPTIISIHDYLSNAGERRASPAIDHHAVDPEDNNPQIVWDKLISHHDQIFMVLCGHQYAQAMRIDANRHGHKVYQILSDYQGRNQTAKDAGATMSRGQGIGDGWMRLMTFDMAAPTPLVRVHTYSTHYKRLGSHTPTYAAWYKAQEKPQLSDAAFLGTDDFTIDLDDFRARFDRTARTR